MPKLSLITLCYNQAPFLLERIRSIRAQTFQDFEWIVIDDCSTDESSEILRQELQGNPRLKRLIIHERNQGVHLSFNEALALCEGEYIHHAAGDDTCEPWLLEEELDVLEANQGVGFVHSAYRVIDFEGRVVKEVYPAPHSYVQAGVEEFKRLIWSNFICSPSVTFRLDYYKAIGGIDDDWIYASDWELWLRFASYYDIAYIAEPLVNWRRYPAALTPRSIVTVEGATEPYRVLKRVFDRLPEHYTELHKLHKPAIRHVSTYWMPGLWAWWLVVQRRPGMAVRIFWESVKHDPGFLIDPRTPFYLADNFGQRLIRMFKGITGDSAFMPRTDVSSSGMVKP